MSRGDHVTFYNGLYYSFVPTEMESSEPEYDPDDIAVGDPLEEIPARLVDERVASRLEAEGGSTEKPKDKPKPKPKPKPDPEPAPEPAAATGSVDQANLPDDIKKTVLKIKALGEEDKNQILADIGAAALKAMQRVGVSETEVYGKVDDIQSAVRKALSGSD
jgi:hypothetical protein